MTSPGSAAWPMRRAMARVCSGLSVRQSWLFDVILSAAKDLLVCRRGGSSFGRPQDDMGVRASWAAAEGVIARRLKAQLLAIRVQHGHTAAFGDAADHDEARLPEHVLWAASQQLVVLTA